MQMSSPGTESAMAIVRTGQPSCLPFVCLLGKFWIIVDASEVKWNKIIYDYFILLNMSSAFGSCVILFAFNKKNVDFCFGIAHTEFEIASTQ